jgi:hypothetical protein
MTSWSLVREAEVTAASASERTASRKVHSVAAGSKGEATVAGNKTRGRSSLREEMSGCSAAAEAAAHDGEHDAGLDGDGAGEGEGDRVAAIGGAWRVRLLGDGATGVEQPVTLVGGGSLAELSRDDLREIERGERVERRGREGIGWKR